MKVFEIVRITFRRLRRDKKRTILTMLGIVIGITAVVTIIALGDIFKRNTILKLTNDEKTTILVTFNGNDNISTNKNYNQNDIKLISDLGIVDKIKAIDSSDGLIATVKYNNKKINMSIKRSVGENHSNIIGRNFDGNVNKRVIIVSKSLMSDYFDDTNEYLNKYVFINGLSFKIIGIKTDTVGSSTNFDCEVSKVIYDRYFAQEATEMLQLTVKIDSDLETNLKKMISLLNSQGSQSSFGEYSYIDTSILTNGISSIINYITNFIAIVAGISLIISGIGVMNMIYTSVAERRKEIGIKRALGASRFDIRNEFLIEGLCITLLGGIIGFLCSFFILLLIGFLLDISITISMKTISITIVISSVIGVTSSFLPAKKASELNTIDILK
ncbi:MAG: FtsX-like permease family protein [Bacilli bacterium]